MADILKLSNVSANFGGKKVLFGVNLAIKSGENWALIGPNGSGKTTLLKIINGYLRSSSGEVEVLGEKFGQVDLRELRKEVAFISSYLNDLVSLDDNVLDIVVAGRNAATRLWAVPPEEDVRRATTLLRMLGCSKYEDSPLRELSQGERQKVFIARALMTDPMLITLDEPCAGLDLKARESFLSSLLKIGKRGKCSMLYVTHRVDEIPACFTNALLFRNGKVIARGKIDSVLTSRNLSKCFDVPVSIKKAGGRFFPLIGGGQ